VQVLRTADFQLEEAAILGEQNVMPSLGIQMGHDPALHAGKRGSGQLLLVGKWDREQRYHTRTNLGSPQDTGAAGVQNGILKAHEMPRSSPLDRFSLLAVTINERKDLLGGLGESPAIGELIV